MSATTLSANAMQVAEERRRRMRLSRRIYDTVWPTSSGVINLTDAAAKPVRGPTREGAYHYPYIEHSTMMDEQGIFLGAEDFDSYIDHQFQSLDIANVPMRRNSLSRNQRDAKRQSLDPSRHSMRQLPSFPIPPRKRSNSLSKVSSSLPNSLRLYPTLPHYVNYDQSPDSGLSSSHPRSILKMRARGDYADRPRTSRHSVHFSERISYSDDVPLSAASAHPQSHTSYTPTSGQYLPSVNDMAAAAQVASLPAQNAVKNANLQASSASPFEREKRPVDIEQWMSGVSSSASKETRKSIPTTSTSPPPAPPPVRVEGFNPPSPRQTPTHRSPRLSPVLSPAHRSPRQGPVSPNMNNGTSYGQRQNTSPRMVASQSVPHLTSPRQNDKRDPRRNADVPSLTLEAPRRNNDVQGMSLDRSNPLPKPPALAASEQPSRSLPREPARDLQRKPSDSHKLERRSSVTRTRQDSPPKEHPRDSARDSRPVELGPRRSTSGEKAVPQIPNPDRNKSVPASSVMKPVPQLPGTALNIDKSKALPPSLDKGKTFPQALTKTTSPSLDKSNTHPISYEKGKHFSQASGSTLNGERVNGEKTIGSFFIPPGSRRESLTNNISTTWRSLIGNGNGNANGVGKDDKVSNSLLVTTSNPLPLPPSLISETMTRSQADRRA